MMPRMPVKKANENLLFFIGKLNTRKMVLFQAQVMPDLWPGIVGAPSHAVCPSPIIP